MVLMVGLWVMVTVMHLAVLVGLLLGDMICDSSTRDEVYGCAKVQSSSIVFERRQLAYLKLGTGLKNNLVGLAALQVRRTKMTWKRKVF